MSSAVRKELLAALRRELGRGGSEQVVTAERLARSAPRIATGIAGLDELLDGGLKIASVSTLSGAPGTGCTSLLRAAAEAAIAQGHRVAVVSAAADLDPADWTRLPRERLWIVRAGLRPDAMWAAEVLCAAGAFGLVAVVVAGGTRRAGRQLPARLRRAAEDGRCALVVAGDVTAGEVGARSAVRLRAVAVDLPRGRWRLEITRTRGGPEDTAEVEVDVEERLYARRMPSHPLVPDRRAAAKRPRRDGFAVGAGGGPWNAREDRGGGSGGEGAGGADRDAPESGERPVGDAGSGALGRGAGPRSGDGGGRAHRGPGGGQSPSDDGGAGSGVVGARVSSGSRRQGA